MTRRIAHDARAMASFAIVLAGISGIMLRTPDASAQSLIHHVISQEHLSPPTMGREFWFGIPSNAVNPGGSPFTAEKHLLLYITSPSNTTAYVALGPGQAMKTVPVNAYKMSTVELDWSWEMLTSGYVQDKAVHVWSNNADLTVFFMSHVQYSADGSYIIPTIGWGTDYVVAANESLFEGSVDFPSEFTIVASTDNTQIQIIPSCDLRQANSAGVQPTSTVYPAGHVLSVTLNRGQSEQFMPVPPQDVQGFDVTGTIIHSTQPIGVMGGAVATNIPIDFGYADHLEDMIPPVRTWASTYYSTSFIQPPAQANTHDYAEYLFVSSKAGQTIWGYNKVQGIYQVALISGKYDIAWEEYEKAQKFYSDAPFMLVEYINSSTYPDHKNGNGDPAEVVINSKEQYTKTVVFETPAPFGTFPYTHYATVTINVKDTGRTTFDGQSILKYNNTMQPIDDTIVIFTVTNLGAGTHIVTGDSAGAGVYIYGYSHDESYAWASELPTGTFHATDTISPAADTMSLCYGAFVHLADFGINPGGIPQSKLNKIQVDSDYNMTFLLDTDWAEGVGIDTSGYGMSITDRSKPAYLRVTVYDVAGNLTQIVSTYQPNFATISPPLQDFGTVSLSGSATLYDTIRNTGTTPFDMTMLKLKLGTAGFTLVNPNLSPLAPDSMRVVEIQFNPNKGAEAYDTILFGNDCLPETVVVEGNAGAPDFTVDDQSWINVPLQKDTGWIQLPAVIHNKSARQDLGVKFISVSDPTHFYLAPGQKDSVTVPKKANGNGADGLDSVWFIYHPTAIEQDVAKGSWYSPDVLEADNKTPSVRNDSLFGNPITAVVTFAKNIYDTVDCATPGDTLHLAFVLNNTGSADAHITHVYASDMVNFTHPIGHLQNGTPWDPSKDTAILGKDGGSDTILVDFPVPVGVNEVAYDTLTALGSNGQPMGGGPVIAQIVVNQLNMTITPPAVNFGPVPYQGTKVPMSFRITNPNPTPVTYTDIFFGQQNGNSDASFSISPSPGKGLPVTLDQGQTLTVTVTLDPSVSFVYSQWADVEFATTACDTMVPLAANVGSPGVTVLSTSAPAVLACGHATDSITLTNTAPIPDTIIAQNWLGADSTVFSLANDSGLIIPGYGSLKIPVEFLPNAQDSNFQTYVDSIQFWLKNSQSITSYDSPPITGTANYASVTVTSQFATPSSMAGNQVMLPMTLAINHNGLSIGDTDLDITGVHLVYLISNPDVLNIDNSNLANAVSQLPPGWTVAAGSSISALGDKLTLNLQGPKLPNGISSLGQIAFRVTLAKVDSTTDVTLDSLIFYSNGSTAGCIIPMVQDSNFSLILQCGDPTLRGFMQGKGIIEFIRAATPDPVTGSEVNFNYSNRAPANITLAIYNVLGQEVARPVDNIPHEAGSWQVSCNVAKLPNGTYTCRLSADGPSIAGSTVLSKRFVIQR
ncbi:MAG: choice-of-anchor D domain-containing protein [Candidatus Kapaibacterium sp.]